MKYSEKNSKKTENFNLTISDKARKEMKKLPASELKKLDSKIQNLIQSPIPQASRKLAGSKQAYRLRQGNYRVIYEIEKQEITVMSVGHRREIYR